MRSFNRIEHISNPAWAQEKLNKTNTDLTAHWTSKLMDHRWQIDAIAGMHSEYLNNGSSNPALNNVNQLEYWGSNLWDLERAPGCAPIERADGSLFQPCPINGPPYHTGGFGLVRKYTGFRWSAEAQVDAPFRGGRTPRAQVRVAPRLPDVRSGPLLLGASGIARPDSALPGSPNASSGAFNSWSFFTLNPGEYPSSFGPIAQPGMPQPAQPYSNLLYPYDPAIGTGGYGQPEGLRQEPPTPSSSRTASAPVRAQPHRQPGRATRAAEDVRLQGSAFIDARNIGPRVGLIYDPKGDGRSKVAFSYGRYYEAIPLNIASRYFGGEGS